MEAGERQRREAFPFWHLPRTLQYVFEVYLLTCEEWKESLDSRESLASSLSLLCGGQKKNEYRSSLASCSQIHNWRSPAIKATEQRHESLESRESRESRGPRPAAASFGVLHRIDRLVRVENEEIKSDSDWLGGPFFLVS